MNRNLILCCALLGFGSPAMAGETFAERVLDLTPERLAAFKSALREFGANLNVEEARDSGIDFTFEESYLAPLPFETQAPSNPAYEEWLPVGVSGRDPVTEEEFLLQGREDDFEDAARTWMTRKIKGSDIAHVSHPGRLEPKYAWNGGPVVGVRKGPLSAMVGSDLWEVRFTHRLRTHPGWSARVSAGVDDGEQKIAFSIGRSLLRSTER
jgi:hypothetical protein